MKSLGIATVVAAGAWAQNLGSLKAVAVPKPSNLSEYVRDEKALVALGKAFYWDMQASSDGQVACATCHFHAGADHRSVNTLSNPVGGFEANRALVPEDFPFRKLSDANNRGSAVLSDSSQRAGSAGLFRLRFVDIVPGSPFELGTPVVDSAFTVEGAHVRRVTGRNSPSAINAIFNVRNFWDGRASRVFNGNNPFGDVDDRAHVVVVRDGRAVHERLRIDNASLASQAVGPVLDSLEMSYEGRTWAKLGQKLLSLRPLARQRVAPDDSVLGPLADGSGRGLSIGYGQLIQAAFQPRYWEADGQMEQNFALYWGLALQGYQATLVSDDSRFDRFNEGDTGALNALERNGLNVFQRNGNCTNCHVGPEFTLASFSSIAIRGEVSRGRGGPNGDTGYRAIGVRPAAEDSGLAGTDAFGNPLSLARRESPNSGGVNGAFKVPGVRNVEFTGPYFHNGGQATLEQLVEFYNRGGDFQNGQIRGRNLSQNDRAALVEFLKSLSDDRVRYERAPFDHPELCVPTGHLRAAGAGQQAPDRWAAVPAVGGGGNSAPLQTFEELLRGIGSDGSRAHALTDACSIP